MIAKGGFLDRRIPDGDHQFRDVLTGAALESRCARPPFEAFIIMHTATPAQEKMAATVTVDVDWNLSPPVAPHRIATLGDETVPVSREWQMHALRTDEPATPTMS